MWHIVQRFREDGYLYQMVLVQGSDGLILSQRTYSGVLPVAHEVLTAYPTLGMATGSFNREADNLTGYLTALMPSTYDRTILTQIVTAQVLGQSHPD